MEIIDNIKKFFMKEEPAVEKQEVPQEELKDIKIELENMEPPESQAKTLKGKLIGGVLAAVAIFSVTMVASNMLSTPTAQQDDPIHPTTQKNNNPSYGLPDTYADIPGYKASQPKPQPPQQNQAVQQVDDLAGLPQEQHLQSEDRQAALQAAENASLEASKITKSDIAFKFQSTAQTQSGNTPNSGVQMPDGTVYDPGLNEGDINGFPGTFTIQSGSVLQATLLTGVTSDVPNGDVVAQVRQNIYDSISGHHLLIPQGTKLIGISGTAGTRGNKRIEVAFKRLILPNGKSMNLPKQKAIDGIGYPGLTGKYDDHRSSLYRTAFMSALLASAAQSATGGTTGDEKRSPGQEAVAGAVSDMLKTGQQIVKQDASMNPTITIKPGTQFSVFINQDFKLGEYIE
jgi:type IV secretory pathway VirB10-like protein